MADGKATRWKNYQGMPKHLVEVENEAIISRIIRLIKKIDSTHDIIITSHNSDYEFSDCKRHEPISNVLEIDRFTEELIVDDMCFLYGDTYYTEQALETIINSSVEETYFFGNGKSIVGIRITDGAEFKRHKNYVKQEFLSEKILNCKGWQVYQSYTNQNLLDVPKIKERFILIEDKTADISVSASFVYKSE